MSIASSGITANKFLEFHGCLDAVRASRIFFLSGDFVARPIYVLIEFLPLWPRSHLKKTSQAEKN